jgi:hypothetical protein
VRWRGLRAATVGGLVLAVLAIGPGQGALGSAPHRVAGVAGASGCSATLSPALAADPRAHALRVFAIQFEQQPVSVVDAGSYAHAIDCAIKTLVVPHLAAGRPNLVVFGEDMGLETLAAGKRGAAARALLRNGVPSCAGQAFPCATLATLSALDTGYARALRYLQGRFPGLAGELGRAFVAATDQFVRVFMGTMAAEARRYGVYLIASNTQAPFRLTSNRAAVAALRDPSAPGVDAVYAPTAGHAYDQTFLWGPQVVDSRAPAPLANLLAVNRKVPLTGFEVGLGFAAGPSGGSAARANLRPVAIPGTGVRLGFATSLPAFVYGHVNAGHACDNVTVSYMNCLDHLGANVLIQADANDGQWTGADSDPLEKWQPLGWMGSAWRAVSDPTVHFAYAVNPFMVGNLADTPFDGQSAILQRGRHGAGCSYIGDRAFVASEDDPAHASWAGPKPQFLALAPWVVHDGPRSALRPVGVALAAGTGPHHYVRTAVIADLPFPLNSRRRGCVVAGR